MDKKLNIKSNIGKIGIKDKIYINLTKNKINNILKLKTLTFFLSA